MLKRLFGGSTPNIPLANLHALIKDSGLTERAYAYATQNGVTFPDLDTTGRLIQAVYNWVVATLKYSESTKGLNVYSLLCRVRDRSVADLPEEDATNLIALLQVAIGKKPLPFPPTNPKYLDAVKISGSSIAQFLLSELVPTPAS